MNSEESTRRPDNSIAGDFKTAILELSDQGKGRSFILLSEPGLYRNISNCLAEEIAKGTRCINLEVPNINKDNWPDVTSDLIRFLELKSIRQASFVAFAGAASILLNLALIDLKLVRSMVLVDASTRPNPNIFQKFIDKVENFLPLGLPLRSYGKDFDSKSFLQRLRCPVLILSTINATNYINSEKELFKTGLPTAWAVSVSSENQVQQIHEAVMDFQKTPAKCPQKG